MPQPIPGTENGSQPLFSPDGQWLAFEADSKEKKVRLDGSAPVTIASGGFNNGADWSARNELIVGSTGKSRGLSRVSVAGGELAALTQPDSAKGETDHLWPIATADGGSVVFVSWSGVLATARLAITSLDHPEVIEEGMFFALETYWPSADGVGAARIEEELVVTATGCEVVTKFPAEELLVAGHRYFSLDGHLPLLRNSQSHLNTPEGRGER